MRGVSYPRKAASFPRMDADQRGLIHANLTEKIIGIFYEVYNELGHGFLESVYEQALAIALTDQQIFFQRQIGIPVWFQGKQVGDFVLTCSSKTKLLLNSKPVGPLKLPGRSNS